MKPCRIMVALVFCGLLAACSRDKSRAQGLSGPPQTGALYSLNDGEGGFRVGKVVATEEEVVSSGCFRIVGHRAPLSTRRARQLLLLPLAFSAQNFAGMQPMHLENGSVSPEELEAYEKWKQSNRDIF